MSDDREYLQRMYVNGCEPLNLPVVNIAVAGDKRINELAAENADLRRQLEAAKGEAQRTVYVPAVDGSQALTNIMLSSCWSDTPEHSEIDVFDPESMQVYAVTLTAREVGKP